MSEPFGVLLRRFRRRAGLNVSELAEAVGASRTSILDWEKGVRVPRDRARLEDLAQILKLAAGEADQLAAAARQHRHTAVENEPGAETSAPINQAADLAAPAAALQRQLSASSDESEGAPETASSAQALQASGSGLPERQGQPSLPVRATPLFGRDADVAALAALLLQPDIHLVTLRGPGGVGKTRLALELAYQLQPNFAAGVVFVELASLRDPSQVLPTIAQALGLLSSNEVSLMHQLQAFLRDQHLLMVLDSIEHLLLAAPLLMELLGATPQVVYLVTSRCALRLSGEYEWSVEPLPIPDLRVLPALEQLVDTPAVACFVARAQAIQPGWTLTPETAATVAAICARSDGLPLAIELAAARLRLFAPAELLQRLERRLLLLAGGMRDRPDRQQTLRATIDWSYRLLTAAEQILFARLAIFVGDFDIAAVEAICGVSPLDATIVVGALESLAAQSLVVVTSGVDPTTRIRLLDTIHEYAQERLNGCGEADRLGELHAAYYLDLAERAAPELNGPQQQYWLARLTQDHPNLRAALAWAVDAGATALLIRLTSAMQWFWRLRNHWSECRHWVAIVEARAAGLEPLLQAKAYYVAGIGAFIRNDLPRARQLLEASWAAWPVDADPVGATVVLNELGTLLARQGEYQRARELLNIRLVRAQEHQDLDGLTDAFGALGDLALGESDLSEAQRYYAACHALCLQRGDLNGLPAVTYLLGIVAFYQDDLSQAAEWAAQSIAHAQVVGNMFWATTTRGLLGLIELRQGRPEQAVVAFCNCLRLYRKHERNSWSIDLLEHLAAAVLELGYAALAAEWLGAVDAARALIGVIVPLYHQAERAVVDSALREQLDEQECAALRARGAQRKLDDTVNAALQWADTLIGTKGG